MEEIKEYTFLSIGEKHFIDLIYLKNRRKYMWKSLYRTTTRSTAIVFITYKSTDDKFSHSRKEKKKIRKYNASKYGIT